MTPGSLTITPAERQLAEDLGVPYPDDLAPTREAAADAPTSADAVGVPNASPAREPAPARAADSAASRVYRGRSVAELIPKIQAELGSEAIVTGRRSGLEGGIGGFFQRPFVEIEAQRSARVDIRDGEDATPSAPQDSAATSAFEPEAPPVSSPAPYGPMAQADGDPFASALEAAAASGAPTLEPEGVGPETADGGVPAAATPALPAVVEERQSGVSGHHPLTLAASAPRTRTETAVSDELKAAGFDEQFSAELLESATAHVLPFEPRIGLRRAARVALERRIPQAAPLPATGAAVVLVGPGGAGKSTCIAALSGCYERTGSHGVQCASIVSDGADAPRLLLPPRVTSPLEASSKQALKALATARAEGLALLDTPPLSPADSKAIRALARVLAALAPERVVVALPATLSASAASRLLQALAPLKPNAVAITHADESDELGIAVQAACSFGLAPEYVLSGSRREQPLTRIDPAGLAARVLP
jgi:flagellar biosynthesis GTPase FlhF